MRKEMVLLRKKKKNYNKETRRRNRMNLEKNQQLE